MRIHRWVIWGLFFLALALRFGFGSLASSILPTIEGGSQPQQAGYLFYDAYHRDLQAYELAASDQPLMVAFCQKSSADQYGGMLWFMAFLYRIFGGSYQPLIPQFFISLIGASGIFFMFSAVSRLFTEKIALMAALAYALYPESILLGASQMREPLLITFSAMTAYAITRTVSEKYSAILWAGIALIGSLLISPGIALLLLILLAGWLIIDRFGTKLELRTVFVVIGVFSLFLIVSLVFLVFSWQKLGESSGLGIVGEWARRTTLYNAHLLKQSSGIVQVVVGSLPSGFVLPFVIVYGTIQPVLPAILFEPGEIFWKIVGFFRSVGWYVLLPMILTAPFDRVLPESRKERFKWLWIFFFSVFWIFLAAARGGGDQWDNPRYRTILLPFFLLLASLVLHSGMFFKGQWSRKIVWIELSSLALFTHWYSWRYTGFGYDFGIRNTILIAFILAFLIAFGDILMRKIRILMRL